MYKHILLPTDGSDLCNAAVVNGIRLAKVLDARVTGVYVLPHVRQAEFLAAVDPHELWSSSEGDRAKKAMDDLEALHRAAGSKYLAAVRKIAEEAGVPCETVVVSEGSPAEGIVEVARAKGCDLICISSHGRTGVSRMFLGSVTARVLSDSSIPVLVYRCS